MRSCHPKTAPPSPKGRSHPVDPDGGKLAERLPTSCSIGTFLALRKRPEQKLVHSKPTPAIRLQTKEDLIPSWFKPNDDGATRGATRESSFSWPTGIAEWRMILHPSGRQNRAQGHLSRSNQNHPDRSSGRFDREADQLQPRRHARIHERVAIRDPAMDRPGAGSLHAFSLRIRPERRPLQDHPRGRNPGINLAIPRKVCLSKKPSAVRIPVENCSRKTANIGKPWLVGCGTNPARPRGHCKAGSNRVVSTGRPARGPVPLSK